MGGNTVAKEIQRGRRPTKATPDQVQRLMLRWSELRTNKKILNLPDVFQSLSEQAAAMKIGMKCRETNKFSNECREIVRFLRLTEQEAEAKAKRMGPLAIEDFIYSLEEAYDEGELGGCFQALENARRELQCLINMRPTATDKRRGPRHPWVLHMANPYGHRSSHRGSGTN